MRMNMLDEFLDEYKVELEENEFYYTFKKEVESNIDGIVKKVTIPIREFNKYEDTVLRYLRGIFDGG